MSVRTELAIRVWVPEVWDMVELAVTPAWTIAEVKESALHAATGRLSDVAAYQVKFRGAVVFDESQTLAALQIPDHAPMIVLRTRRQPVR